MDKLLVVLLLIAGAVVHLNCNGSESSEYVICDENGVVSTRLVVGGTTTPQEINLTDRQKNAVLGYSIRRDFMMYNPFFSGGGCTASLISPRHVLTAAHCIYSHDTSDYITEALKLEMVIGNNHDAPLATLPVESISIPDLFISGAKAEGNPYDIAIITLKAPISPALDKLVEILTINLDLIPYPGLANDLAQAGGFGATTPAGNNQNSDKFWTSLVITTPPPPITNTHVYLTPIAAGSTICFGDSGGPLLWLDKTQNKPIVLGTASFISSVDPDFPCNGLNIIAYTSTESRKDFIQSVVGAEDLACAKVSNTGFCDNSIAKYCENGTLIEEDCRLKSLTCSTNAYGLNRCLSLDCVPFDY